MRPSVALPSRASLRSSTRRRVARVRSAGLPILQTAGAAGAAWWLAPLAAVIALGTTRRKRGRRALQVALGVSVGIGAAGLGVRGLGLARVALLGAPVASACTAPAHQRSSSSSRASSRGPASRCPPAR